MAIPLKSNPAEADKHDISSINKYLAGMNHAYHKFKILVI